MKKVLQNLLLIAFVFSVYIGNAQIRITLVDPNNNMVWVRNYGASFVDIANYRFCFNGNYPAMSSLTFIGGGTSIGPSNTRIITGLALDNVSVGSDVALYLPDGGGGMAEFSDPTKMVDFMQYGSAGHLRESVAVTKGIWGAGDFVGGFPAYNYTGNGTQTGVTFWGSNPTNAVKENNLNLQVSSYPNPVNDILNIKLNNNIKISSYKLIDIDGKVVIDENNLDLNQNFEINLSSILKGNYTLFLVTDNGILVKKIVVI